MLTAVYTWYQNLRGVCRSLVQYDTATAVVAAAAARQREGSDKASLQSVYWQSVASACLPLLCNKQFMACLRRRCDV